MREWPGNDEEKLAFFRAIRRQCGCEKGPMGVVLRQAGCHELLIPTNNRWSHLVFMRRQSKTLRTQEFGPQTRVIPGVKYTPQQILTIYRLGGR